MSIFKRFREKFLCKSEKNTENKIVIPRKKSSSKDLLPASIAERAIAENKAEREAKEAIQKDIDREIKRKSKNL